MRGNPRFFAWLILTLAVCGCGRSGPSSAPAGGAPRAEIAYTKDGVLHVRAVTVEGAYYALGWATARDRAFQLELFRLAGLGRSSELLGNGALRQDGFIRSLGVPERAQALVPQVERQPFARRILQAYAPGVKPRCDSCA